MLRTISSSYAPESCSVDDNEMYEIIPDTIEGNIGNSHSSEIDISCCPKEPNRNFSQSVDSVFDTCSKQISIHCTISRIKDKLQRPRKISNNHGSLHLLPQEDNDINATRAGEICAPIRDVHFDVNQIQAAPESPTRNYAIAVCPPPLSSGVMLLDDHSTNIGLAHLTRASIECANPESDYRYVQDTQTLSLTSASSTNSSNHEFDGIDRSLLSDEQYVEAQRLDFERLTIFEVDLTRKLHSLENDYDYESQWNQEYNELIEQNTNLKKELKRLQEESDQLFSPWACDLCTLVNQPFSITKSDVCEACESPSPLKRAKLTQ